MPFQAFRQRQVRHHGAAGLPRLLEALALAVALEFEPDRGGQAGDGRLRSLFGGRDDARSLLFADGLADGGPTCAIGGGREGRLGFGRAQRGFDVNSVVAG